jgi:hypothetical protein
MSTCPSRGTRRCCALAVVALALSAPAAFAQAQGKEVYNATASLKTEAGATMTAPVVLTIDRWTTDEDRDKVVLALKGGGTPAVQNLLASMPDTGSLRLGKIKTPVRFARSLPVAGGKVVTLVTAQPVFFVGAGLPGSKPVEKAGYNVAVVIFQVDADGKGDAGDLAPAAKVKLDDKSGFVVEDYGAEAVRLNGITKASSTTK